MTVVRLIFGEQEPIRFEDLKATILGAQVSVTRLYVPRSESASPSDLRRFLPIDSSGVISVTVTVSAAGKVLHSIPATIGANATHQPYGGAFGQFASHSRTNPVHMRRPTSYSFRLIQSWSPRYAAVC